MPTTPDAHDETDYREVDSVALIDHICGAGADAPRLHVSCGISPDEVVLEVSTRRTGHNHDADTVEVESFVVVDYEALLAAVQLVRRPFGYPR